jgi:hypothetical protein
MIVTGSKKSTLKVVTKVFAVLWCFQDILKIQIAVCTCPNDLKMMAGGFYARIGSTKSDIK